MKSKEALDQIAIIVHRDVPFEYTQERFGFGKLYDDVKQDLDRLERLENELKKMAEMGMSKFQFPNGMVVLGFYITEDEVEKYRKIIKDNFLKLLQEVLCNED